MNSASNRLLALLILLSGCRSITTVVPGSEEEASRRSVNIVLLGSLILEYHKKNNHWPEDRKGLEQFYDSAKLFLVNFDTLSFRNEPSYLTVNYRFIENPSSPATMTFVDRDTTESEKFRPPWCHDTYSKSNVTFDGQLLFKYDNGYYTCL